MHRKLAVFALLVAAPLAAPAVGQDWTKSKWGPADEIGAANYITPELVVKAAQLVKTGKTYALGIETNSKTPAYPPRGFKITIVQPGRRAFRAWVRARPPTTTISSMAGSASAARSTASATSAWSTSTTTATSSPTLPMPAASRSSAQKRSRRIVARGVLLDMAAHFGTDIVKEGTAFNTKEIEEVAKKQGVEIRQGDVVLFHTGWIGLIGKDDKRYNAGEPGLGVDGAKYLAGKGVVAVGADTWGLEAVPFETKNIFEVHQILLPMNGTYILENMNTGAAGRRQGLRVPVRSRRAEDHWRGAGHHQPHCHPLSRGGPVPAGSPELPALVLLRNNSVRVAVEQAG